MYTIKLSKKATDSISSYKRSNPKAYKKVSNFLREIQRDPRKGTGHPEPLKGYNGIRYSREITKKDRLVYDINDNVVTVLVVSAQGHYDDK